MGLVAQLQVWIHRRRLAPLVYLGCALLIVLGLVRWEPRTHEAVVNRVGALKPAWTKPKTEQEGVGKDPMTGAFRGNEGARPAARPKEEEPPPPTPPKIVEVPYDPGTPSCPEPSRPSVPSTPLGGEADLVYASVGRLCLDSYVEDLDQFLLSSFPAANASLDDPDSLRSQMHRYLNQTFVDLPTDSESRAYPMIPRTIHQTNREHGWRPQFKDDGWQPESWPARNVGWDYAEVSDVEADAWVEQGLTDQAAKPRKGKGKSRLDSPGMTRMLDAWRRTKPVPVMRSDLWRYLKLLVDGGVYADLDAECLKPIDMWSVSRGKAAGGEGEWARGKEQNPPSMIIGIEADVGDRPDWHRSVTVALSIYRS